jgi:hypothetical protein
MKTMIVILAAALLCGCGNGVGNMSNMSNSDLQLRHSQVMYRLSMTRVSWGRWGNAYDDIKDDLEEKEEIERELARRRVQ